MKKITNKYNKIKYRVFKGAIISVFAVMLTFPVGKLNELKSYYHIYINGNEVGTAESEEAFKEAYRNARLSLNEATGSVNYLGDITELVEDCSRYTEIDTVENLSTKLLAELESENQRKVLAYTVKIDDYTVTLGSREEIVKLLEAAQDRYDINDEFSVELTEDNLLGAGNITTNVVSATKSDNESVLVASKSTSPEGNFIKDSAGASEGLVVNENPEDRIIDVSFKENVEINATYVDANQIISQEVALDEITKDKATNLIYEVQKGDCLSTVANDHDMTTKELLAINPDLDYDSNIFVGDEIIVMVPEPELSVLVDEQKTYTENYDAEVIYIDNENVYVGDNTVLEEGKEGTHTVTAIISSSNGKEYNREIINEIIIEEAVPKVIERGTKPIPTYIKPLTNGMFSSGFGARWGTFHYGVDWACSVGTAVRASCAGTVIEAGWSNSYGYTVLIDHGASTTRYAHLSKLLVSYGEYVNQGDKIALSGNTGDSTGPHLHFEISINGTRVNPLEYIQ